MNKKRKTREQKIKSAEKRTETGISYSVSFSEKSVRKKKAITPPASSPMDSIRKILTISGIIFAANIILFVLLSTQTIKLNFLGY